MRRITDELLAYNNGYPCGSAQLVADGWLCYATYRDGWTDECATVRTQQAAIAWLREAAMATKILRCPAIEPRRA